MVCITGWQPVCCFCLRYLGAEGKRQVDAQQKIQKRKQEQKAKQKPKRKQKSISRTESFQKSMPEDRKNGVHGKQESSNALFTRNGVQHFTCCTPFSYPGRTLKDIGSRYLGCIVGIVCIRIRTDGIRKFLGNRRPAYHDLKVLPFREAI